MDQDTTKTDYNDDTVDELITPTTQDKKESESNKKSSVTTKTTNTLINFFVIFSIFFVFSIFFFNVLLMPLSVQDYSMYPTLNAKAEGIKGDRNTDIVYIKKTQSVTTGDIIVFDATELGFTKEYFIKRVIAVAGDKIQFKTEGQATERNQLLLYKLYINEQLVDESSYASETLLKVGYPNLTALPDASNIYKQIISQETITVPDGKVFVMGDNRQHSSDSRHFGFVKTTFILGKVRFHYQYGSNMIFAFFHSIKEDYLF